MACHWIKFTAPDGAVISAHVKMAAPRRRKCAFCDHPDAQVLCDYELRSGHICNKALCDRHRVRDGDRDYCIAHDLSQLAPAAPVQESLF